MAWVFYSIPFTLTHFLTALPTSSQQAAAGLTFLALSFPLIWAQLLTLGKEGIPIVCLCGWRQPCPAGLQGILQTLQICHRGSEEARLHDGDLYSEGSHVPPGVGAEGGFWVLALIERGCSGTWVGD